MAHNMEAFERRKVELAIKASGTQFVFYRNKKNDFGEPLDEAEEVARLKGLYHTNTSYISVKDGDSGSISNMRVYTPCVLCLKDEASEKVVKGDYTTIAGKKIVVTGKVNYLEKSYAFDINCEVVEDG